MAKGKFGGMGGSPKKKQDNTEIDEVLQKAQSLDIEITELN